MKLALPVLESPPPLARELDEANAALAQLHAEHDALCKKLGDGASPPTSVPREVATSATAGGGYRGADPQDDLRRAVDKANAAVANLGIENAILQSRWDERVAKQATARRTLLIALSATLVTTGVVWLYVAYTGGSASGRGLGPLLVGFIALARLLGFKKPSQR